MTADQRMPCGPGDLGVGGLGDDQYCTALGWAGTYCTWEIKKHPSSVLCPLQSKLLGHVRNY